MYFGTWREKVGKHGKRLKKTLGNLSRVKARLYPLEGALWYRGVNLDLTADHPVGAEVVWWGASSCTPKLSVAQGSGLTEHSNIHSLAARHP